MGEVEGPSLAVAFAEVEDLADAFRRARMTVAVAESCTGGLLGAALTAIAGSSDYMRGGVIAYADSVKADLLGVSRHDLAEHGAVSERVAVAMAEGVRRRCDSDVGVAITGVAGPGGSAGKPAGLVYVAVTGAAGARVERLEGDRGREENRSRAVHTALRLCRDVAAAASFHRAPPAG